MTSEADPTQEARAQARTAIDRLIRRVRNDGEYAARYRRDPVGLLLEEGMPADGVASVLREGGASDEDVAGFAANYPSVSVSLTPGGSAGSLRAAGGWPCICTSCCTSACCITTIEW
ncbi:MAG: hypothetical protein ACRDJE_29375 [Dehalococcoidia bacterium]